MTIGLQNGRIVAIFQKNKIEKGVKMKRKGSFFSNNEEETGVEGDKHQEKNGKKGMLIAFLIIGVLFALGGYFAGLNQGEEQPIGQCSFNKGSGLYQLDAGYYIRPSGERIWVYGGVAGTMTDAVNLSVNVNCKIPKNVLETTVQIPAGEFIADEQGNGHVVYMVYMAQKPSEAVTDPLP